MEHLLEMRNLSIDLYKGKKVPSVKLVEGIDLNIGKKQNFGVVGESGCGKSITCSTIMGLLSYPLSVGKGSSIRFQKADGTEVEITSLPKSELRKLRGKEISTIFQEPMTALDPMYTIGEQINETLRFHTDLNKAQMREVALEMLRKVKIPRPEQILVDYPHHLSGGMLQRVMIAIALINNPRLLIADEPTTALDVTIQAQILELMNDLKRQTGTSILFITHDLGVIHEMADEVAVMYCGQIVEKADAKEIFHKSVYSHPYTEGLMISIPRLNTPKGKKLDAIPGAVPNPLYLPKGCKFAPRCKYCTQKCLEEEPPLTEVGPNHLVRCFYAEKAVRQQNAK